VTEAEHGAALVEEIIRSTQWERSWFPRPEVRAYRGRVELRMDWADSGHLIVQPGPQPGAAVEHVGTHAVVPDDYWMELDGGEGTPPPRTRAEAAQKVRAFLLHRADHELREHLRAGDEWCFAPHGGPSITSDARFALPPSTFYVKAVR
jgi:hypothetical protein